MWGREGIFGLGWRRRLRFLWARGRGMEGLLLLEVVIWE